MTESKLTKLLMNIGRSFPLIIIIGHIFGYFITYDYNHYLIFLIAYIINEIINILLKYIIKEKRPSNRGYIDGNVSTGCGIFPSNYKLSKSFGMPSGHAQSVSFTAIMYTLYLYNNSTHENRAHYYEYISICVIWLTVCIVCWSRIKIKCHSPIQVFFGSTLGILIGFITYYILSAHINIKNVPEHKWKWN